MFKKLYAFILCCVVFFCLFFTGCGDSKEISLDGVYYRKVTFVRNGIETQGYEVIGCDENITILKIKKEVKELVVLSIAKYAFENNKTLKEIVIPDTITSITAAFKGCDNIQKVTAGTDDIMKLFTEYGSADMNIEHTVPKSLKYVYLTNGCEKIGIRAFYYCSNIEEIHIPIGVKIIEDGTGFTTIPANGNNISSSKFKQLPFIGCTKLTIYCEAETKPDGWGAYWNYINQNVQAPVFWGNY